MRIATLGLAAALLPCAAAPAQDGGKASPPAKPGMDADDGIRRTAKALRLLKASNWLEQTKAAVTARVEEQEKRGALPAGAAAKFLEVVDWNELLDLAVASYVKNVDEDAMDAAIVFYESPEGRKFAKTQPQMVRAGAMATSEFVDRTSAKAVAAIAGGGMKDKAKGLLDRVRGPKHVNEVAAIMTLRNLASCQAQVQASGKIDVDNDGIGEYGTILELTGAVGSRKSEDGSKRGTPINPPILSPSLAAVEANGVVTKSGYCFRVYLPGTGTAAGFIHETGPADKAALQGGSVATDVAESTWCAYAWPEKLGETGERVFFVTQEGDVWQSSNDVAKWDGGAKAPPGRSAFRGAGITSPVAVGTHGNDGDVWRLAN